MTSCQPPSSSKAWPSCPSRPPTQAQPGVAGAEVCESAFGGRDRCKPRSGTGQGGAGAGHRGPAEGQAPFDGIAASVRSTPATISRTGQTSSTSKTSMRSTWISACPSVSRQKSEKGQRAQVDLDALPGRRFNAVIQAVDPAGRQRALGRCASLHRQPPVATAPRHVRPRHPRFRRTGQCQGGAGGGDRAPGQKAYVIKVVDGPGSGQQGVPNVEVKRWASGVLAKWRSPTAPEKVTRL